MARRSPIALLVLAFAARLPCAGAEEPAEEERPYDGRLPDPERDDVAATRIVDAATGGPIPGARLQRFLEDASPTCVPPAPLLGVGTADEQGFAWVSLPHGTRRATHWVADAPGYAANHEYGESPPDRMALRRGITIRARVLDAFGRPAAGALVDAYMNCSHGPSVARASADAEGLVAFDKIPREALLWVSAPGCAAAVFEADDCRALGDRPADLVLGAGRRARGRVVDLEGKPLARVIVRTFYDASARGVVRVTGDDGAFDLFGIAEGVRTWFHHPNGIGDAVPSLTGDDWRDGFPLVVPLTAEGFGWKEGPPVRVRVRPAAEDARGAIRLVRVEDGRAHLAPIDAPGDDGPVGFARMDVTPGRYRVLAADSFSPWDFRGEIDVLPEPSLQTFEVAAVPRPRLEIGARAAEDLVLAAVGEEIAFRSGSEDPEDALFLPADAEAVVRVTPHPNGPTFFFPVGPPEEGARRAEVAVPPPHRILVDGLSEETGIDLHVAGGDELLATSERVPGGLETYAVGSLLVRFDVGGETREIPAGVPSGPPAEIRLRAADAVPAGAGKASVRLLLADGSRPDGAQIHYSTTSGWTGFVGGAVDEGGFEVPAPAIGVVTSAGLQPLDLRIDGPGERTLRWGSSGLRLAVVDPTGERVAARVALDGHLHTVEADAPLVVRGLSAGPHEVFVVARDDGLRGARLTLVLKDGETRERTVRLTERPER